MEEEYPDIPDHPMYKVTTKSGEIIFLLSLKGGSRRELKRHVRKAEATIRIIRKVH